MRRIILEPIDQGVILKRILISAILSAATMLAVADPASAQGFVTFNTYSSGNLRVTYSDDGSPVEDTWHAEVYYALGDVTGSVVFAGPVDPTTSAPSGGGLQLYTGVNNVADFFDGYVFGSDLVIPGYTSGLVTFVIIAYSGSDWNSSTFRGHSVAFTDALATGSNPSSGIGLNGTGIADFQIYVPEPSTYVMVGMGAVSLLALRRRK